MPMYLDRHYIEGITRHAIEYAHEKDLAVEKKYGVRFRTYWFDEVRCTGFCLVESPDKETIHKAHAEAHGAVPSMIIEIQPAELEKFLGRLSDPVSMGGDIKWGRVLMDSAFRAIMFTDLKDSTAIAVAAGDKKALHLLHVHNALTRDALQNHAGREVKHTGDGVMASFTSVAQAIECAIAIQEAFAAFNSENAETPLHLRIGITAGEPVEEENDLFGAAVNLAARVCAHAEPDQILAAPIVVENYTGDKSVFSNAGEFHPKGFTSPVQVYQVNWQ